MCLAGTREAVCGRHEHPAAPDDAEAAVPRPTEEVAPGGSISRRGLLGAGLAAAVAAALPASSAEARTVPARRMLDLTHVFSDQMPTWGATKPTRQVISGPFPPGQFGFYDQRWSFTEHMGTHMDAPGHVIGGGRLSPDLRPDELLAPAVVIDVSDKAARNPNAVVTVADVVAFERRHGRIPRGAAVLMHSGWAARWRQGDLAYRGTTHPDQFPFNFPGFSAAACEFLVQERAIVGVGVDTLSTDPGNSTTFPAHEALGRSDRWGIENLANLDAMPARGATVVVGLVPWAQGSGGPCRVLALW